MSQILGYPAYHGEQVLWEGTPVAGPFRWRRLGGWLAVAVVMLAVTWLVFLSNVAVWGLVNGLMIILTGLNLLGRAQEARSELPNVRYAITNHRIILRGGHPLPWTCAIALQDIQRWRRRRTLADRFARTGSIVMRARYPGGKRVWVPDAGHSLYAGREVPALWALRDAPTAAAALEEALAGARGREYACDVTRLTLVS